MYICMNNNEFDIIHLCVYVCILIYIRRVFSRTNRHTLRLSNTTPTFHEYIDDFSIDDLMAHIAVNVGVVLESRSIWRFARENTRRMYISIHTYTHRCIKTNLLLFIYISKSRLCIHEQY